MTLQWATDDSRYIHAAMERLAFTSWDAMTSAEKRLVLWTAQVLKENDKSEKDRQT